MNDPLRDHTERTGEPVLATTVSLPRDGGRQDVVIVAGQTLRIACDEPIAALIVRDGDAIDLDFGISGTIRIVNGMRAAASSPMPRIAGQDGIGCPLDQLVEGLSTERAGADDLRLPYGSGLAIPALLDRSGLHPGLPEVSGVPASVAPDDSSLFSLAADEPPAAAAVPVAAAPREEPVPVVAEPIAEPSPAASEPPAPLPVTERPEASAEPAFGGEVPEIDAAVRPPDPSAVSPLASPVDPDQPEDVPAGALEATPEPDGPIGRSKGPSLEEAARNDPDFVYGDDRVFVGHAGPGRRRSAIRRTRTRGRTIGDEDSP